MIRVNVLLLVAVVLSALYLVHTQYESRRLFVELEKAALQMRKLEMDSESALAEKRAQATPMRVDKLAKEKLKMHRPRRRSPSMWPTVIRQRPPHR